MHEAGCKNGYFKSAGVSISSRGCGVSQPLQFCCQKDKISALIVSVFGNF